MASGNSMTDASSSQAWTASSANLEDELFDECTISVKPEWQIKLHNIHGKEKVQAEVARILNGCKDVNVERKPKSDLVSTIRGPPRAVIIAKGELLDLVDKFQKGDVMVAASNAGVSTSLDTSAAHVQLVGSQSTSEIQTHSFRVTTDPRETLSGHGGSAQIGDIKSSEAPRESSPSSETPLPPLRTKSMSLSSPSAGHQRNKTTATDVVSTPSAEVTVEVHIWAYLSETHALEKLYSKGVRCVMKPEQQKLVVSATSEGLLDEAVDDVARLCNNLLYKENVVSWPVLLNADCDTSKQKHELLKHSVVLYRTTGNVSNASGSTPRSPTRKAFKAKYLVIGPKQQMSYALQVLIDLMLCIAQSVPGKSSQALSSVSQKKSNTGPSKNTRSQSCQPYHFRTSCGLDIHIYQGDLTGAKAEVIVSPNNVTMKLGAGASKCIAEAAGWGLKNECQSFIKKYGQLTVSEPIHTTAGNLPKPISHVIHVAGPIMASTGRQDHSYQLLMETFYNCLEYANRKLTVRSIAIPAISSGHFGMPKQVVASRAFEALMRFNDRYLQDSSHCLREVHFVNIDAETTIELIDVFGCLVESTGISTVGKSLFSMESTEVSCAVKPANAGISISTDVRQGVAGSSRTLSRGVSVDESLARDPPKGSVDHGSVLASSSAGHPGGSGGNDDKGTAGSPVDHTGVPGGNLQGRAASYSTVFAGADNNGVATASVNHLGVPKGYRDRRGSDASALPTGVFVENRDGLTANGSTYSSGVAGDIGDSKAANSAYDRSNVSESYAAQNAAASSPISPPGGAHGTQASHSLPVRLSSADSFSQNSRNSSSDGASAAPGAAASFNSNAPMTQKSYVYLSMNSGMTNNTKTNSQDPNQQCNAPLPGVLSEAASQSKPYGPPERFTCNLNVLELKASDINVVKVSQSEGKSVYRCVAVHWYSHLRGVKRYYNCQDLPEDPTLRTLEEGLMTNLHSEVVSLLDKIPKKDRLLNVHSNYNELNFSCSYGRTVKDRIDRIRLSSGKPDPLELLAIAYLTKSQLHLYRLTSSAYELFAKLPPFEYSSQPPILLFMMSNGSFQLILSNDRGKHLDDSVNGSGNGWMVTESKSVCRMLGDFTQRASDDDGLISFEVLIGPIVSDDINYRESISDQRNILHRWWSNISVPWSINTKSESSHKSENVLNASDVEVIDVKQSSMSFYRCVAVHCVKDLQEAKLNRYGSTADARLRSCENRLVDGIKREVITVLQCSYDRGLLRLLELQLNYTLCDVCFCVSAPLQRRIDAIRSSYDVTDPLALLAVSYLMKTPVHLYREDGKYYKPYAKYPLHAYTSRPPLSVLYSTRAKSFKLLRSKNRPAQLSINSESGTLKDFAESASESDKKITFEELIDPNLRLPRDGGDGAARASLTGQSPKPADAGPISAVTRVNRDETKQMRSSGFVQSPGDNSPDMQSYDLLTDLPDESCVICMDKIEFGRSKKLPCGHVFCADCIDECFKKHQPRCPSCSRVFGVLRGNQPKGYFRERDVATRLPGYEQFYTIEITYSIPDGVQTSDHPNPGQPYKGTRRTAYLPDNPEGREVCGLLKRAFDAGLVFTIDRSVTTGKENCVVWNNIHHKTMISGTYGYPDSTYLTRVKDELAAKGIVPPSATKL